MLAAWTVSPVTVERAKRLSSCSGQREHWSERARGAEQQRAAPSPSRLIHQAAAQHSP